MILAILLIIPVATALLSYGAEKRPFMEKINLAGFAVIFALALALGAQVLQNGTISLWNGFFYADAISALVILLTASVALLCAVYAVAYLREDERSGVFETEGEEAVAPAKLRKYYTLTPLFVFAMLLVPVANNLGVMWVAIEMSTLASVFLVTFYGKSTSLEAAWKYAIIGGVGLAMALFGTVLAYYSAYGLPGSDTLAGLNWSVLVQHASELDPTTMRMAFILILLGYGTKAGLAPMHTWKPDAYSEAPVPSAAMLSTATLNCALYGLIRFYILTSRCLGPQYPGGLLLLLGILSMGVAAPFVLVQKNFRRLLAYSSIEHAGIMATALGLGGMLGTLALMLHMVFHTAAKSLLFLCAGNVHQHFQTDLFRKVGSGVIRSMPITGPLFFLATLAVVGMPPFSLFQSEFLILRAGISGGHSFSSALFVLFAVGAFAGLLLHVTRLLLGPSETQAQAHWSGWRHTSMLVLAAILVVFGFWMPASLFELIQGAARVVTGGV